VNPTHQARFRPLAAVPGPTLAEESGALSYQSRSSIVQHLGPPPDLRSSEMSTNVGS
jgi:hypothetical protein